MSTDFTPKRRPSLRRCAGWATVALLAGGGLVACGDEDPNLEDPAAGVVFTGDKDNSIGTPSTFPTTTVLVSTTFYFPDNELGSDEGGTATDDDSATPDPAAEEKSP